MCGIFVSVSRNRHIQPNEELQALLANRGPDNTSSRLFAFKSVQSENINGTVYVTLYSTVLSLRGDNVVEQPVCTEDHESPTCLCWNGEAWTIDGIQPSGNDTQVVFDLLKSCPSGEGTINTVPTSTSISMALSAIAGPYSFAYLDGQNRCLYFGRDFLGRRSLLSHVDADGSIIIASVSGGLSKEGWREIEADGINCLHFSSEQDLGTQRDCKPVAYGSFIKTHIPYNSSNRNNNSDSVVKSQFLTAKLPLKPLLLSSLSHSVAQLEERLRSSLSLRITGIPEPPTMLQGKKPPSRAKLAVLFSGGLDCTVLARLCHDLLPNNEPIDLLNVAFENPRIHKPEKDQTNPPPNFYELCPDRVTGRASYSELKAICPDRPWRFVAIDIPYAMTLAHRQQVITLMHPHNTEMDLSISFALYFASRGAGTITIDSDTAASSPVILPYATSARVFLSGLGADELFGGYQRHATAFNRSGFKGLHEELELDITRLGSRNLGRDDRVLSNWARETRFPFLDERLLEWAAKARIDEKCGFGEPDGGHLERDDGSHLEQPKKALRCLSWKLGMRNVAAEKKRAIQFGARTAKMEGGKTKGTDLII